MTGESKGFWYDKRENVPLVHAGWYKQYGWKEMFFIYLFIFYF